MVSTARDTIDRKARVWTVTLGRDGKLAAELNGERLASISRGARRIHSCCARSQSTRRFAQPSADSDSSSTSQRS